MQLCTSWNNRSIPNRRCSLSVCLCRCLLRHTVKSTLGTICPSHCSNQLTDPPITIISLYCPPRSSLTLHFVLAAPAAHTATTVSAATCSSHCSNQLTIPTCRITCRSLLPLCTQYTTAAAATFTTGRARLSTLSKSPAAEPSAVS